MLNQRTLKHFKMFRDPFLNDIRSEQDIFFSAEHMFLRDLMLDTARYSGFIGIFGGVGSGKSTIRKAVVQALEKERVRIVYPLIIDKSKIYPGSLLDAIIYDIASDEKPKRLLEQKSRQAIELLKARAENKLKQVIIIEEAHMLTSAAFKALKQIYELENRFDKLIGIVLIGQNELASKLDETLHPELREVSRRCTLAEIGGLKADVPEYLTFKFKRVGKEVGEVFDSKGLETFGDLFKGKNAKKSFPLAVNNAASRCMNMASELAETFVTDEIVRM